MAAREPIRSGRVQELMRVSPATISGASGTRGQRSPRLQLNRSQALPETAWTGQLLLLHIQLIRDLLSPPVADKNSKF